MTIHFAAAESPTRSNLGAAQVRVKLGQPANDNTADEPQAEALHAALRHFAKFGIGAAAHARDQAERAFFAGDRETYRWWLGVCRTLNNRMASQLDLRSNTEIASTRQES